MPRRVPAAIGAGRPIGTDRPERQERGLPDRPRRQKSTAIPRRSQSP